MKSQQDVTRRGYIGDGGGWVPGGLGATQSMVHVRLPGDASHPNHLLSQVESFPREVAWFGWERYEY